MSTQTDDDTTTTAPDAPRDAMGRVCPICCDEPMRFEARFRQWWCYRGYGCDRMTKNVAGEWRRGENGAPLQCIVSGDYWDFIVRHRIEMQEARTDG